MAANLAAKSVGAGVGVGPEAPPATASEVTSIGAGVELHIWRSEEWLLKKRDLDRSGINGFRRKRNHNIGLGGLPQPRDRPPLAGSRGSDRTHIHAHHAHSGTATHSHAQSLLCITALPEQEVPGGATPAPLARSPPVLSRLAVKDRPKFRRPDGVGQRLT